VTPAAYDLKQIVARTGGRVFWLGDRLAQGLPGAHVYLFPDQDKFDADEIEAASDDFSTQLRPRLPHDAVIFEVVDRLDRIGSQVVYLRQSDDVVEGFLLWRSRSPARWTDVMACATWAGADDTRVETHPLADDQSAQIYAHALCIIVRRALTILALRPEMTEGHVPRTRRAKLARAGVTGWTWRVAHIDIEAASRAARAAQESGGGTHASPRWHIRRGHWRTLPGGKRTFVREAKVGDPAKGGVVKDYVVAARRYDAEGG
jgi:hypothetical protein